MHTRASRVGEVCECAARKRGGTHAYKNNCARVGPAGARCRRRRSWQQKALCVRPYPSNALKRLQTKMTAVWNARKHSDITITVVGE